jgi:hypothetical protein
MIRRKILAMALATGALLAVLTVPAYAAPPPCWPNNCETDPDQPIVLPRTIATGCEVSSNGSIFPPSTPYDYSLEAKAYYIPTSPGVRKWFQFDYKVDGLISGPGPRSNVNIRLYDGFSLRMEYKSPDNRGSGHVYQYKPDPAVFTSESGADDYVRFEAIFDRTGASDPKCVATTGKI